MRSAPSTMMRLVLKHYKRVVLVDTGRYDLEPLRERVRRRCAELYDLAVEEVAGHHADPGRARGRRVGRRLRGRPAGPRAHAPGLPAGALRRRVLRPAPRHAGRRPAGVNVLCIAGFLGSGKTTILLEVARALAEDGAQLAVIENEIGEVGIDGGYVREQGLPVQELFGGCICCTLQVGLVRDAARGRDPYDPDWVIIEPTGLAAPGDILGAGGRPLPDLDVVRVLTVVDAARWPMLLEVVEPLVTVAARSPPTSSPSTRSTRWTTTALAAVLAERAVRWPATRRSCPVSATHRRRHAEPADGPVRVTGPRARRTRAPARHLPGPRRGRRCSPRAPTVRLRARRRTPTSSSRRRRRFFAALSGDLADAGCTLVGHIKGTLAVRGPRRPRLPRHDAGGARPALTGGLRRPGQRTPCSPSTSSSSAWTSRRCPPSSRPPGRRATGVGVVWRR